MTTLVRYNTVPTLFDRMLALNSYYNRPAVNRGTGYAHTPAVNVKEDEGAFHLEVAAPGLKKEDFKVNVHKNTLTISFKQEQATEEKTENYTRKEFGIQAFERSFRLPKNVNADQIQAAYVDGILKLDLPKVEVKEVQPKEIAVA
ncbi:hypothetical protein GCM10023189_37360 [Nibrella saemangeumensis]|uniref:SHSP domain-containing protein n=1 Tax=Nibrella saemangeumensis TaxID=1084526 RepID=A0ABP8N5G2_9BACT